MVVHAFNLSTQEAEVRESLWVQGQPMLKGEFNDNLNCIAKPCLRPKKKKKKH